MQNNNDISLTLMAGCFLAAVSLIFVPYINGTNEKQRDLQLRLEQTEAELRLREAELKGYERGVYSGRR